MAEILQQNNEIIDFDILINGNKIKDTIEVQEITIEMEVNRITSAIIVINDGATNEHFANSEGKDFIPGSKIEVSLGNTDKTEKVFRGIIVSQRLKMKGDTTHLTVTCKDKAVTMTKGRYNAIYQNNKDSDAIKALASKYALNFEMDTTTVEHSVLMQHNCSDWDYLVMRAEANNMLVTTYQNKLSVKKIDLSPEPKVELKASQNVIDIDLSLESENISGAYNMSSWNPNTQEIVTSSLAIKDVLSQGNLSAKKLSDVLGNSSNYYSSASLSKDEMEIWLESQANMAALEKIKGKITVLGTTKIKAGDIIMLSEFSARFNGNAFISKITHNLQNGEWFTELHLGKSAKQNATLNDVEDIGASGLIPALKGPQIAKVKQIIEDPDSNYRILVTLPTFKGIAQEDGIWARLAIPYATKGAGFFFFPERGDEVLLTFINNDPRFPVITGSMYSTKNTPKETLNEKNQFKSIYSKSGIKIRFDDEDKILSIETPSKNTIVLDDKNKSVSIKDMHENSIVMNHSGITMKTPKDINLKADGNINLKASANLAMKATADAMLDGFSITQNAQTSFKATGNASAELSASGETTVKGAMVMIN